MHETRAAADTESMRRRSIYYWILGPKDVSFSQGIFRVFIASAVALWLFTDMPDASGLSLGAICLWRMGWKPELAE
jgi:hypothetical protein